MSVVAKLINADYTVWQTCENHVVQNKFYHPQSICNIDVLQFSTRLGSESANGQVYRFAMPADSFLFAIKVMPIKDQRREIKIQNEIKITKELSGTIFTPKYFDSHKCKLRLNQNSTLAIGYPPEVQCYYMCMELLSFDLRQLVNGTVLFEWNDKTALDLVVEICKTIYEFNSTGFFHNDLHLGNVMFRCHSSVAPDVVLVDFGETSTKPKIRDDIWSFLKSFVKEAQPISNKFPVAYKMITIGWNAYSDIKYNSSNKIDVDLQALMNCFKLSD